MLDAHLRLSSYIIQSTPIRSARFFILYIINVIRFPFHFVMVHFSSAIIPFLIARVGGGDYTNSQ